MSVQLTWLGQAGVLIEGGGHRVLIDPLFTPLDGGCYEPVSVEEFGRDIDWLLITHEHVDHFDEDAIAEIARVSPQMTIALPACLVGRTKELAPGRRVLGVLPGDVLALGENAVLRVTRANHHGEPGDPDLPGDAEFGRFLGYVVDLGDVSTYHSGDTVLSESLIDELSGLRIDVAVLPINGRDFYRERQGIVGNLTAAEAVGLAAELQAAFLVPVHWDYFPGNRADVGGASDSAVSASAQLHVVSLARAVPWTIASSPNSKE